ncbi:hypothetical protein I601_1199 [Nocardioides dokdonensis FR1436]|uniref:Uncharacterized protein n=1 Tax=Nocardioides dokdonensis FR1436 TaxID=1300347 RepID=A0A1A9GJG2_9ACTN|nr:hypothetical protein [Nocardioides dokdonensis]ANH37641.1 hypothetical protein I601_1199 [Nocardioides dokdonensis FR1436]
MSDAQMTGRPTLTWALVADADGGTHLESHWTIPQTALAAASPAAHAA